MFPAGGRLGEALEPEEVRRLDLRTFPSNIPSRVSTAGEEVPERKEKSGSTKKIEGRPFLLSEALPAVPARLVKKILKGEYVDMAELLRDNVEAERRKGTGEGESSQPRRREIPDILSWVQCFSAYAAIVGTQYPGKWKELLAYQALIVSEYRRCGGKGWLLYDAAFRQQITDFEGTDFSKLNQSLYLTTFAAHAGKGRSCGYCMLADHSQEECALRPQHTNRESSRREERREPGKEREERGRQRRRGACFAWNDGNCALPYCRFEHVCSKCFGSHRRSACQNRPWESEKVVGARGHQRSF